VNKKYQVLCYTNFILQQKHAVEQIIQVLADNNAFTNYRGGILEYGTGQKENFI
jgi:hypothetical protein